MRRILLLLPFIATLAAVPLYNRSEPEMFGFPFFYWYLFACLFALPLLLWLVHRSWRR
ncbi:MAG TPA: DUF3311 domain-containing protein [Xanthomonadaceae bacterium]|jgi:hypothetical protein